MSLEYDFSGFQALNEKLNAIDADLKTKGGRFALRKSAQKLRNKARENAKRNDNSLTKEDISLNIVERWSGKTFKRTGNLAFRVGVLGGARSQTADAVRARRRRTGPSLEDMGEIPAGGDRPGGDTFYWRFLEFGTSRMAAKPFMRPAAEQSGQEIIDTFVLEYDRALTRALKRLNKK